MRPTAPTLPALGNQLQKILSEPQSHTVSEAAAVIERLLAELQIMQQNVPQASAGQRTNATWDDGSLEALFEAELATSDPLSRDDVNVLAGQLQGDRMNKDLVIPHTCGPFRPRADAGSSR